MENPILRSALHRHETRSSSCVRTLSRVRVSSAAWGILKHIHTPLATAGFSSFLSLFSSFVCCLRDQQHIVWQGQRVLANETDNTHIKTTTKNVRNDPTCSRAALYTRRAPPDETSVVPVRACVLCIAWHDFSFNRTTRIHRRMVGSESGGGGGGGGSFVMQQEREQKRHGEKILPLTSASTVHCVCVCA